MNLRRKRYLMRKQLPLYIAIIGLMSLIVLAYISITLLTNNRLQEFSKNQCLNYGLNENCEVTQ